MGIESMVTMVGSGSDEDVSLLLPDAVDEDKILLDPWSDEVKRVCTEFLQLNDQQYQQIQKLVECVQSKNSGVNLISRRMCTPSVIFTRHVFPSLVGGRMLQETLLGRRSNHNNSSTNDTLSHTFMEDVRIIDVGTGGGFPGLPLAIQYPDIQFVLADSIGKKITAITEMVQELNLSNVVTYRGRVEDYFTNTSDVDLTETKKFDIVTGRSVARLPQFCAWATNLLNPDSGHLVYWIGGEIDPVILQQTCRSTSIEEYLSPILKTSYDKRVLFFPVAAVRTIASALPTRKQRNTGKTTKPRAITNPTSIRPKEMKQQQKRRPMVKGEWRKKNDPDQPKQRGHENFQRFTSTVTKNRGKVDVTSKSSKNSPTSSSD
jgi:16S rRNA (guanine(527)-N(7))-methyltransferase RsmG